MTTVEIAENLAEPVLEELGLILWDVTFSKEGSLWILRYLIDKEEGLSITDCEAFSRKVDLLLDEKDPINESYTLEVSSPGVERDLTKDWHFDACMDDILHIKLIRPIDGEREFVGKLIAYNKGELTLLLDEEKDITINVKRSETAFIRLNFEF